MLKEDKELEKKLDKFLLLTLVEVGRNVGELPVSELFFSPGGKN